VKTAGAEIFETRQPPLYAIRGRGGPIGEHSPAWLRNLAALKAEAAAEAAKKPKAEDESGECEG